MANLNYYPLTANIGYQAVVCVDGFITEDDLNRINTQLKVTPTTAAIVGGVFPEDDGEFEKRRIEAHKVRKSNVSFLSGDEWNWLFDKLVQAVNHVNVTNYHKTLYGIEPLQYAEYDSKYNGFYGPHFDSENNIKNGLRRSLSFSLQLSNEDEYEGGELKILYDNKVYVSNKKLGSITFFDSNMLHEVTPVTSGFRKSLVGWVSGPRV